MVTHKEAVKSAVNAGEIASNMVGADRSKRDDADAFLLSAMLRAYLDARGLVMVPKTLTHEMELSVRKDHEGEAYLPYSLYAGFVAAAPDPFGDAE